MHPKKRILPILACLAALTPLAPTAQANARKFTYSYQATTLKAGQVEYEQWVTIKRDKKIDRDYTRIDIRHEIEWGITDNLQAAIYYDWRYEDSKKKNDYTNMRDVSIELIYNTSSPTTDLLGSAIYAEIALGEDKFKIETKLLLQKNINQWVFAWNGIAEAEWEGDDYSDTKGVFAQTLGASYQISHALSVGAELLHQAEYKDWSTWSDTSVYLGPNLSYSKNQWWVTVTPMYQLTDNPGQADYQIRVLFGYQF